MKDGKTIRAYCGGVAGCGWLGPEHAEMGVGRLLIEDDFEEHVEKDHQIELGVFISPPPPPNTTK